MAWLFCIFILPNWISTLAYKPPNAIVMVIYHALAEKAVVDYLLLHHGRYALCCI